MEAIGGQSWKGRDLELPDEGPGSLARFWRRFAGLFIDGLLLIPVVIVRTALRHPHFVTEMLGNGLRARHLVESQLAPVVSLALLVPSFLYTVGLIAWRGQTVGEQAMGLRVIRLVDRHHPGLTPSLARWLVVGVVGIIGAFAPRLAGWLVLWTLLVYLWAAWDANRQGLHDKFAQVIVVRTR